MLIVPFLLATLSGFSGTKDSRGEFILSKETAQFQAGFIETPIDDRMVIALKNPTQEDLELEILDYRGNAIYSEKIKSAESFIRRYDFSELNDGNYEVKVSGDSGEFSESILLR